MQTIYVGNTLINDIALGAAQIQNIWATPPEISTLNLQYWFDTSFSASSVNWKANFGNATGSLTSTTFNSSYPPRYVMTGVSEINFSTGNPGGSGFAPRTNMVAFNTTTTSSVQNIVWYGNPGGGHFLELQISTGSGALSSNAYLKVQMVNDTGLSENPTTSSVAYDLGPISPNKWYVATLQTTGSRFSGISVWLNNVSQSFTGNGTWTTDDIYWSIGSAGGGRPFAGSIQSNLYYNSVISASAILQNLEYYKLKLAL